MNIIWKGPLREDDREDQIKVVETFTNMRVKGIVLAPLDDTRAGAGGDRRGPRRHPGGRLRLEPQERRPRELRRHRQLPAAASWRASTWRRCSAAGQGQGDDAPLRRGLGQHGGARAGLSRRHRRAQGDRGGQRQPVRRRRPPRARSRPARTCSPRTRGPTARSTVQGIFCPNESTAFGMLRALEDGGLAGKVAFVGFDSSPKLVDALAKGHMDATVVQDPIKMGYLAVKAMVDHLAGRAGRQAHRHRRHADHARDDGARRPRRRCSTPTSRNGSRSRRRRAAAAGDARRAQALRRHAGAGRRRSGGRSRARCTRWSARTAPARAR